MAIEIERKFLVKRSRWQPQGEPVTIRQGYLKATGESVVRVRTKGQRGFLTVKGKTHGMSRLEFEYEIPLADANQMLDSLAEGPLIEKQRFLIPQGLHLWEVDVFFGDNAGLMVAEIELQDPAEPFTKPDWVGEEVTEDARYFNSNLALHPYKVWATPEAGE
ncbi:MAG TPA: CYTH domain-containing protein [Pseudomonadales bacterium]|nr:CYTH domain-containing protein [Pseudomonadales bacterium]